MIEFRKMLARKVIMEKRFWGFQSWEFYAIANNKLNSTP